jgi:hypothetical protein
VTGSRSQHCRQRCRQRYVGDVGFSPHRRATAGDAKHGLTCKGSDVPATHRDGPTRPRDDWGSRGRRFKSCHPDGELQVSGPSVGIVTSRRLDRPLGRKPTGCLRNGVTLVDPIEDRGLGRSQAISLGQMA